MTEQEEKDLEHRNRRRRARLLGVNFEVPLTWLVAVIVLGLMQFGVFWQQFKDFGERLLSVQTDIRGVANAVSMTNQTNAVQDIQLQEMSRRLERLEERLK